MSRFHKRKAGVAKRVGLGGSTRLTCKNGRGWVTQPTQSGGLKAGQASQPIELIEFFLFLEIFFIFLIFLNIFAKFTRVICQKGVKPPHLKRVELTCFTTYKKTINTWTHIRGQYIYFLHSQLLKFESSFKRNQFLATKPTDAT